MKKFDFFKAKGRCLKKAFAGLTAAVMASVIALPASADTELATAEFSLEEPESIYCEEVTYSSAAYNALPDSDTLLEGYFDKMVETYSTGISNQYNPVANDILNSYELQVYNQLKTAIADIAAGNRSSAIIETSEMKLTYSQLGITSPSQAGNAILEKISTRKLLDAILSDMPYELYWFNKAYGVSTGFSSGYVYSSYATFKLKYSFKVSSDFGSEYTLNTTKTKAAAAAAKNASKVIAKYSTASDLDKLNGYRSDICDMVEYNHSAAASSSAAIYGNPWQLIWAFDGDPTTNIVCEGYSKAFKYLCDKTTFGTPIYAYLVSGIAGGPHMWNFVEVNGKYYLADLTNCDSGTIGYPDKLFLKGVSNLTTTSFKCAGVTYTVDSSDSDYSIYKPMIAKLSTTDLTSIGGSTPSTPSDPTEPDTPSDPTTPSVTITGAPTGDVAVGATDKVTLKANYVGSATPTYRWFSRATASGTRKYITGANKAEFTLPSNLTAGTYYYGVYVKAGTKSFFEQVKITVSGSGTTPSDPTDPDTPTDPTTPSVTITGAPTSDVAVGATDKVTLTAKYVGTATPTYRWFSRATASGTRKYITGANKATFTLPSDLKAGTYYYGVYVKAGTKSFFEQVKITVSASGTTPSDPTDPDTPADPTTPSVTITGAPTGDVAVGSTDKVTLTAKYVGNATPTYRWFSRATASGTRKYITGANKATFTLPSGLTAGTYYYGVYVKAGTKSFFEQVKITVVGDVVDEEDEPELTGEALKLLNLVNDARASYGLAPLKTTSNLTAAAEKRAVEIKSYYSHTRPTGKNYYTVLSEYDISYSYVGENISRSSKDAESVFKSWMSSSMHRAFILSPNFTHIGIGDNGYYWVLLFIG